MNRTTIAVPDPLLVSGPNGGGIAVLHGEWLLPLVTTSATGLASSIDTVAWCEQAGGIANTVVEIAQGRLSRHRLAEADLDLHDLLQDGDRWHLVSTQDNAVRSYDLDWRPVEQRQFHDAPDAMHLNCLCIHDGRLLVSAFGRFSASREYKGRTRQQGLVIDVASGDTVLSGLSQPHSLVSAGGALWLCDSETNELVRVESGGAQIRVRLPGYCRGLWVTDTLVYVGLSRSRNASLRDSLATFEHSAVAILRREDLSIVGYVPLPWPEIYDIRPLPSLSLLPGLVSIGLRERQALLDEQAQELAETHNALASYQLQSEQAVSHLRGQALDLSTRLQQATESRAAVDAECARRALSEAALQAHCEQTDAARLRHAEAEQRLLGERDALYEEWKVANDARLRHAEAEQRLLGERDALYQQWKTANDARLRHAEVEQRLIAERDAAYEQWKGQNDANLQHAEAEQRLLGERDAIYEQWKAANDAKLRHAESEQRLERGIAALELEARDKGARIAALELEASRLREEAHWLAQVRNSRSWRWTRPFRVLARMLRTGNSVPGDRARLHAWLRKLPGRVVDAGAPMPHPEGPRREPSQLLDASDIARLQLRPHAPGAKPDIYVWAVIDWHFRTQRPQHLARALAEGGHRVFYISNNFVDHAEPGFAIEPLDGEGRLFQVHLHLAGMPAIYHAPPAAGQLLQLEAGLEQLRRWHAGHAAVCIVQHPYWTGLAERVPAARLVYDCMDHHAGFADNGAAIVAEEERLLERCDLTVVTSQWLEDEMRREGRAIALIRNAGEFEHFAKPPRQVYREPDGRQVIGYYGAIAEWFDWQLVSDVAQAHPGASIVLVGSDTAGVGAQLAHLPNVRMVGEVPYADLPYWLHGFDTCLLPFRIEPLTLATNPVKLYEYLAAGRSVVVVDLPEMIQFDDAVSVAGSASDFVARVGAALAGDVPEEKERRIAFARRQTWAHRAAEFDGVMAELPMARASVIVVTYNNLDYTRACLHSLEQHTDWPQFEIIVVDNASHDGTPKFLGEWASAGTGRKIILNDDNRGFAAANNQGLAAAEGDFLVLLNNDTYVTNGWLRGLLAPLRADTSIGLTGPVTNNIGNEARVAVEYADMDEMARAACLHTALHRGRLLELPTLAFFCVAMTRATYERVGPLDEAFGIGFFEDDDYCRRVALAGLRSVCVEDVFVHHHLSASFDNLKQERRQQLFERNKAIFESKWGPWQPHRYRA